MNAIVPVILSGGAGTRLWPVSRESFPKQFWPLVSSRSMIQETARRALDESFGAPIVVANEAHRFVVAEHIREAGIAKAQIVLEPEGRNSAPAITAAALLAAADDPASVLWMMPADAAITDTEALHRQLAQAAAAARAGRIVTFGIHPTGPETGYGYIERGAPLDDLPGVHALDRFIEKPDAERAAALIASGRHLWNSGMFVFTAETLLAEMAMHAPDVLDAVRRAVAAATRDPDFIRLDAAAFRTCPAISLDYAVAERTDRAAVVPGTFGWSDVGSWASLWELGEKDGAGNVAKGEVVLEGCERCYALSDGTLVTLLGLSDVVVIVTGDAVLAMPRGRAQDVRRIVERLKREARPEAETHNSSLATRESRAG